MEEFIKDLTELFNKHGMLVAQDTCVFSMSPLRVEDFCKEREITISFTEIITDEEEAGKHADKYGVEFKCSPCVYKKSYSVVNKLVWNKYK